MRCGGLRALEQFEQDCAAYTPYNETVAYAYGRLWRFLGDSNGFEKYQAYLDKRAARGQYSNEAFFDAYQLAPRELNIRLASLLKAAQAGAPEGSDKVAHSINVTEMVGATWAAIAIRQNESKLQPVIQRHFRKVQQILEPYVLNGLSLVSGGRAPLWLSEVVLASWGGNSEQISVFTPLYGSKNTNVIDAGEAMSSNIMRRYENARSGSGANGYSPQSPRLGIAMAYHQLMDVAGADYPPGMLSKLIDRFERSVKDVPRRDRKQVCTFLPREVSAAVADRRVLMSQLGERTRQHKGTRRTLRRIQ